MLLLFNPAQTVTSLSCAARDSVTAMADSDGMVDEFYDHLFSVDSKSDETTSDVVLDRSDHCSSDTEVTPRTESVLSQPAAPFVQSVHTCYLTQAFSDKLDIFTEKLITVKSNRGSKENCEWWKHQQHDSKLFGAQLIGDTATPQKFAGMSFSDLSFCWYGISQLIIIKDILCARLFIATLAHSKSSSLQ